MKRDTLLKMYLPAFRGSGTQELRIQPIGKAKPPYDKQARKTIK
jgi:hypothetical protein